MPLWSATIARAIVVQLVRCHQRAPFIRLWIFASGWWRRCAAPSPSASASRSTRSRRRSRDDADAAQQRAARDAGRGDEDVVAARRGRRRSARGRGRSPASTSAARSSSSRGQSFPCIAPPRHLIAAAEMTPSGVPPMPISRSTPVPGCAAAIAGATSPSRMRFTRAPASRSSAMRSSWRSRSSTTTVRSFTSTPFASATRSTFSVGERVDVDRVRRLGPDGDLVHVDGRAGEEHRPALGDGDHGDRVRHPERRQPRALERVDRDVDLRARCRRRPPRRCRASAPRPSRPRRSRRRRASRPC